MAKPVPMPAGLRKSSLRFLTWCCVVVLAFLSLLPAEDMVRTGFPGELEHFAAYAGSGAIAIRIEPGRYLGHWGLLAIRRHPWISSAFLAGSASRLWGFRRVGVWRPVRRHRCCPPLALALCDAGLAWHRAGRLET